MTIQGGDNVTVSADGNTITIDAEAGADGNTQYEGKAEVTAGSDYGSGEARFGVYEKAPAESRAAGKLSGQEIVLTAGENVKIAAGENGTAVISAKDTQSHLTLNNGESGGYGTRGFAFTLVQDDGDSQLHTDPTLHITAGLNTYMEADPYGVMIHSQDTTYTVERTDGQSGNEVSRYTLTSHKFKVDEYGVPVYDEDGLVIEDEAVKEVIIDTDTRNKVVAGNNITVTADGDDAEGPVTYTINAKDTKVTSEDQTVTITETVDEEKGVTTYDLSVSGAGGEMDYAGDTGSASVKLGNTVNVVGGATELTEGNIGVVAEQDGDNARLTVKLAKDIKDVETITVNKQVTVGKNTTITGDTITTNTFKAGDTTINKDGMTIKGGPTITKTNVDMGGQQIHNVAAGTADTDAVNVSQLKQSMGGINKRLNNLNRKIGSTAEDANAGVAMALAAASLPQAYLPGKSMMAVAGGTYRGEQGYAIGFSSVSDGGNWVIKANAASNTQGHYGAAVGAGYMW